MRHYIAIIVAVLASTLSPAANAQDKFQTYTVKDGDTCTSIAREVYGDARAYHHIHEHNDLSSDGYACRPGVELRLPVLPDQPEAQLLARAGNVRAKPPNKTWDPVDVGADLFSAWRVNTLEQSRAELGFRDSSELQMTENTLVVIFGPSKASARRVAARRANVEKGRLKSQLAALSGQQFEVETPHARATLDAGRAQVTVDEDESRIANHTGTPVGVTAPDGSGAVRVQAGQGTRVLRGQPPEKPRPLPATPQWTQNFSPRALTIAGTRATVRAEWKPVAAAKHYYVEVTRDRRQIDVLFSKRTPASVDSLEMRGLPPGEYFVSIVAIDDGEFESIPSELRRLTVLELGTQASHVVEAESAEIVLGGVLRAPRGTRCAVRDAEGNEAFAEVVRLSREGTRTVVCEGEDGRLSTDIEVVKPTLRVVAPESGAARAMQGSMNAVDVAFTPGLPADVTAKTAGDGLEAKSLQIGPDRLRINLTAGQEAQPGTSTVELYYQDVLLGDFEVIVESAESGGSGPQTGAVETEYLLTALVGYDAVSVSPYWGENFPAAGASLEIGLGSAPTRHFAAEARAGFGLHSGDELETVITLRAQALAGWFDSTIAPHAGLGVSWQGVLGADDRFSPRASIGIMPSLNQYLRLRGEIAIDATPIAGTIQLLPEARLGLSLRF
jgi:hypothetical protein